MKYSENDIIKYFDIVIKNIDDESCFSINNILVDNQQLPTENDEERDYFHGLCEKIKVFGESRGYFKKIGDVGWMKLTEKGIELKEHQKGHQKFKQSKKIKPDYLKWTSVILAGLSLTWNIYQGYTNNQLRLENRDLGDEVEALQKENAGLLRLLKKKTD